MEGCFLSLPQAISSALLTSCVLCICGVSVEHLQEVGHSFSTPKETRSLGFAQLLYINNILILLEYSLFILSLPVLCLLAQWCPTLCSPMDCSLPGSSVHGFLQTRILEWVAMLSSRGPSQLRDQTAVSHISCTGRWVLCH